MSRWSLADSALPLLALLVALGLLAVPLLAGGDTHGEGMDGETVFVVELDASGDAHWQVTERIPLGNESEVAAFATVAEEFEAGAYDLTAPDRIDAAARAVDGSTERSMAVTDPNRTSAIEGDGDNRTGALTVSFTWENFARMAAEGDELYIDDVLETEQGLWLDGLTADQTLVVRAPDGYAVLDASVPPQNGSLHWDGPATFDRETLSATFVGDGDDTDTDTDTDDTNSTDETDDGDDDGDSAGLFPLLLVGVLVVAVAAVLAVYRDRLGDLLAGSPASAAADDSATDGGGAGAEATDERGSTGTDEPATPADEAPTADSPADTDDGIDEELLSDEERVERLLEQNGGRMKQADIVDETDWSNAKVSQLLSSMADEDRVDKLRIGRENLISFPDVDVTDSDRDS